jgi:DNA replication licensing factor MCM7
LYGYPTPPELNFRLYFPRLPFPFGLADILIDIWLFNRLATALARLRIVDQVEKEDVNEAMRLMEMSKDSLTLGQEDGQGRAQSTTDKIYSVIREMAGNQKVLKISDVKERCMSKGYKPDQIDEAIDEYEELNVFSINQAKTKITLIDVV